MKTVTQIILYRQALIKYAEKYGAIIAVVSPGQGLRVLDYMNGGSCVRVAYGNGGYVARKYTTGANGTDIANDPHVVGQVTAMSPCPSVLLMSVHLIYGVKFFIFSLPSCCNL